eukprot:TRINITY_DN2425_c0_g1_i1.p4 TRINITY_DN2425_c0_g1~~TRINITY_DN2425_c0_g1_i1.p4  ORF type:complete len:116 (+),score=7.39 TRINITY_DN2425_c0_g1_i1:50-349(+)
MMSLTNSFLGAKVRSNTVPLASGRIRRSGEAPLRQITCMAKKKGVRMIITVECTEARAEGKTPSRYTTQKNKKNTPDRLEIKKYNPFLRRHTLHREIKK